MYIRTSPQSVDEPFSMLVLSARSQTASSFATAVVTWEVSRP